MSGLSPLVSNETKIKLFTTVWRKGVDGERVTRWDEDISWRQHDLLYSVTHEAFLAPRHFEATECEEALDNLNVMMGPVHETEWGCLYSEAENGWFRPECKVTNHPFRTVGEKTVDLWSTPGGAFLIIFIILLCVFFIWWFIGCFRIGYRAWPWTVWANLGHGRASYKKQRSKEMDIEEVPGRYGLDNDEDDDTEDIYLSGGTNA